MLAYEHQLWTSGHCRVAGVDEAGRGPLAGPVVAAAFVFTQEFAVAESGSSLAKLTDSKKLTELQREAFYGQLRACESVDIGVGVADVGEIDSMNILRATHLAMQRAVADLNSMPDHILVDGRPVPGLPVESTSIVKGDSLSLSIAAASIIAKVTRDNMMLDLDAKYPEYGFAGHKGYGTQAHVQALMEYGPCPAHRRSFRPVREAEGIHRRAAEGSPVMPPTPSPEQGDLFRD